MSRVIANFPPPIYPPPIFPRPRRRRVRPNNLHFALRRSFPSYTTTYIPLPSPVLGRNHARHHALDMAAQFWSDGDDGDDGDDDDDGDDGDDGDPYTMPKGSKQTEEPEHNETLDMGEGKEAASGCGSTEFVEIENQHYNSKEGEKETGLGLTNTKDGNFVEWYSEVAWVTRSGSSDLEVPIAIRPTSETVMYPYFSKWIRGHRDLPLRLNQWCNVVCWEFSNPTPFIRSREFLWQEGHTAFATKEEADSEVLEILELYRRLYEEYLAVPVVKGKKSELEKFAGGLYTTSVEAFIPNTGRGVQGATSHCLGQNFAKMFEINFEDEKGEKIGVIVMVHGDDKGPVLPPKISAVHVIVIRVPFKDADFKELMNACSATVKTLCDLGIRAEADLRENYSPGWKYSHWEMKGVPLRIEIGPKDLANNQVRALRRDNGSKVDLPMADLGEKVKGMLDDMKQSMFDVAKRKRDACIQVTKTWDEFIGALGQKKLILAPWCDEEEVEKDVKAKTKGEVGAAKTLCSPFDQHELPEGTLCFCIGKTC